MAAKLSRSWSFFRGRHAENKHYLHEDYQPPPQNTRVNLQQRFNEQDQKMRNRPLPPPPTQSGFVSYPRQEPQLQPHAHQSGSVNRGHEYENLPPQRNAQESEQGPSNFKRKNFSSLSTGVLPLSTDLVNQVKPRASKVIQEGGKKMNRALQGVKTSVSSFTQMFRSSTRRRYKLDARTPNRTPRHNSCRTPRNTPGKLYSPFNMTTPVTPNSYYRGPKRLQHGTPRRNIQVNENMPRALTPQMNRPEMQRNPQWVQFDSPSRRFGHDVMDMRSGLQDLESVSSRILGNRRY